MFEIQSYIAMIVKSNYYWDGLLWLDELIDIHPSPCFSKVIVLL